MPTRALARKSGLDSKNVTVSKSETVNRAQEPRTLMPWRITFAY